ncbi:hypothetical protein ON010_g9224 [Phytophthora cinnamomi]|nr:hypothetical protein ON010_g9224 [Phytophthora cinnamomi]
MKRLQCAGGVPDNKGGIVYENSGFLTADFTQKACAAATGSINPIKKGNQKCCTIINFRNGRVKAFNDACNHQKAGNTSQQAGHQTEAWAVPKAGLPWPPVAQLHRLLTGLPCALPPSAPRTTVAHRRGRAEEAQHR